MSVHWERAFSREILYGLLYRFYRIFQLRNWLPGGACRSSHELGAELMQTFTKTIRGIRLTAVRHGIGWRVSGCNSRNGMAHTAYAEAIDVAAQIVLNFIEA